MLLTKVVVRLEPFTWTTDPEMKLPPLRVNVNPPPPAMTLAGEILESDGAGFGLLTVRVSAADTPPPGAGFITVVERVPAEAMSLARIAALS